MTTVTELPQPRLELKRAIGATGLPAWKVGLLANLSATQLSHIVTGRREVRPDEARRLASVLRVDVDDVFPELEA